MSKMPSQAELRRLFTYNPETGNLTWNIRSDVGKAWNTRYAGKPALATDDGRGYLVGRLAKRKQFAHRIIYKWMTGFEPNNIDHINGNPSDNRWKNLRNVTQAENMKNQRPNKRNTSGFRGVHQDRKSGKWVAQIRANRVHYILGNYDDFDDAVMARQAAEIEHGFHENHGR